MTAGTLREPFSLDKLRRWLLIKWEHLWRRRMYVRKAAQYVLRPRAYLQRRRLMQRLAPGAQQARYLQSLHEVGWTLTPDLVNHGLLSKLDGLVQRRLTEGRGMALASAAKGFWRPLLHEADLSTSSPFIRYALQESLVGLAAAYLGQVPYLARVELVVTTPTPDENWKSSQRWHRDHNDRRLFKFFTYFTDVPSKEYGPFTLIPGDVCDRLKDPLFPIHKTDAMMDALGGTAHRHEIYGPRLTSFAIDTSRCYHCGSRIVGERYRIVLILTYTTFATYQKYNNGISIDRPLAPVESLVLQN